MLYSKISLRLFKKKINYQNLLPWLSPGLADDSLKLELPFLVGSHLFFVCTYIQQFASAIGGTSRSPIPVILLGSVSCHFLRSLSKECEGTEAGPPGEFSAKRNLLHLLPRRCRNLRRARINLEVPKISRGCYCNRKNKYVRSFIPQNGSQNCLTHHKTGFTIEKPWVSGETFSGSLHFFPSSQTAELGLSE